MKYCKGLLAILIFICASASIATEENNTWKLLFDRKGVRIYNRDIPGSPIREFMGRCVVDASLYTVGVLMLDFPAYPQWVASCKDLRSVACRNALNCDLYYVMALPWPVSNRDVILRAVATVYPDEGIIRVQCDAIPDDDRVPLPKGYIRLKSMYVKWILKQLPDGKTDVTFLSWAEPGGFVPSFVANMSTSDFPYKSLVNLGSMVKLPKYVEASRGMNGRNYHERLKLAQ